MKKERSKKGSKKDLIESHVRYVLKDFLEIRSSIKEQFNKYLVESLMIHPDVDMKIYPLTCFLFNRNLVIIKNGEKAKAEKLVIVDAKRNRIYSSTAL